MAWHLGQRRVQVLNLAVIERTPCWGVLEWDVPLMICGRSWEETPQESRNYILFIVVFLLDPLPLYVLSALHCILSRPLSGDRWIVIPPLSPLWTLVCNLTPQLTKWLNQMAAAELYCHEFHLSSFWKSDSSPFTPFYVCCWVKDVSVMETSASCSLQLNANTGSVTVLLLSAFFIVASP